MCDTCRWSKFETCPRVRKQFLTKNDRWWYSNWRSLLFAGPRCDVKDKKEV